MSSSAGFAFAFFAFVSASWFTCPSRAAVSGERQPCTFAWKSALVSRIPSILMESPAGNLFTIPSRMAESFFFVAVSRVESPSLQAREGISHGERRSLQARDVIFRVANRLVESLGRSSLPRGDGHLVREGGASAVARREREQPRIGRAR